MKPRRLTLRLMSACLGLAVAASLSAAPFVLKIDSSGNFSNAPEYRQRLRDMQSNFRQQVSSGTRAANNASDITPPDPTKTAEQVRQEEGEAARLQADQALAAGNLDQALALFQKALDRLPNDTRLEARLDQVRMQLLYRETARTNTRRADELHGVLDRAAQSLPAQLRQPPPSVALAEVLGSSDTSVVDLRGVTTFVVDPAFFQSGAAGNPGAQNRRPRFVEPPAPGEKLSPLAFQDSPYAAIFESPEWDQLMREAVAEAAKPEARPLRTGELHRVREAMIRKLEALPPRDLYAITTANARELEASRLQVQAAYQDYLRRRNVLLGAANHRSIKAMRDMIDGMEKEGWWKPGDNIEVKLQNDPGLNAEFEDRARVVRWYSEVYLDEAENTAYREVAARVTRLMNQRSKTDPPRP